MDLNNPNIVRWDDGGVKCWGVNDDYKHELILDYARRFELTTLIETGTYHGDTVECTRSYFKQIHSIELSPKLFADAEERFRGVSNVHIYLGDSGEVLRTLLGTLSSAPVLFWLDAHPSGSDTAQSGSPLERELLAILDSGISGVILIDDLQDCWTHDWAAVASRIIVKYPRWKQEIKFGIMRVTNE